MCQNGHNAVRKACGNLGGEVRDGAGKRVMECEMCTENDKEGRGWENDKEAVAVKVAEVQNMARHVLVLGWY
jgi:hypothetical protein